MPNRTQNRTFWVLPILLSLGLFFITFKGFQEIRKIRDLAQKRETLIQFNQNLNSKNEQMYREIFRLKQDPAYIEEIARKEFGLVKPDEIIFFIDEGQTKEVKHNGAGPHVQ